MTPSNKQFNSLPLVAWTLRGKAASRQLTECYKSMCEESA
jgi:hypothetical protein